MKLILHFIIVTSLLMTNNHSFSQPEPSTITLQFHASTRTRDAFTPLLLKFEQETNIKVIPYDYIEDSELGKSIHNADLAYGHNSQRIQHLAKTHAAAPLTQLWREHNLYNKFPSEITSWLSVKNDVYGVPYTRNTLGLFYKKSMAKKHGEVPKTWNEFVQYCLKLKKLGYEIFPASNQQPWIAAAWFEYFILRMHGLKFYKQLTSGLIPYSDKKVQDVFLLWQEIIELGLFSDKFIDYTWQEYTPAFIREHFVFAFMGINLIQRIYDESRHDEVTFMAFPKISDIPRYESSPTSIFYLNNHSANKHNAKKFLAFIAKAEQHSFISDTLYTLPVNSNSKPPKDILTQEAHKLLKTAAGISPFFDRVVPVDFDKPSALALSQFIFDGDIEKLTKKLEALRLTSYKDIQLKPQ